MEQKINALKTASKVIAVITKIGYIAMTVMVSICVAMLIFLAVTGGVISRFTIGKTNIIFFDSLASTPAELAALCAVLIVLGGLLLAIFVLAYRMFREISLSGEAFQEKYAKTIRVIGILTAVVPFATGLTSLVIFLFTRMDTPDRLSDISGIVVGAIIFCLSYIIDYGCGLRKKSDEASEAAAEQ